MLAHALLHLHYYKTSFFTKHKNNRPLMRLSHVFLVVFVDVLLDVYEGGKKPYSVQETCLLIL